MVDAITELKAKEDQLVLYKRSLDEKERYCEKLEAEVKREKNEGLKNLDELKEKHAEELKVVEGQRSEIEAQIEFMKESNAGSKVCDQI